MPTNVIMPQLGESVDEGTVTKWLKAVGDTVQEFEPLVEINTDKVDTEVPSPAAGVLLKILIGPDTTVKKGDILAVIGAAGEATAADTPQPGGKLEAVASKGLSTDEKLPAADLEPVAGANKSEAATPTVGRDRDLGFISPVVAKIAGEQSVDLYQVQGTGEGGRITKKDVLAYLENRKSAPVTASVASAPKTAAPVAPAAIPAPLPVPHALNLPGDEIIPMTTLRRSIAEHMVMSERTSPHVTTVMEVDLSRVVAHRAANKDAFAKDGVNLTFTAYFMAATAAALKAYPIVNSSWSEQGIVLHRQVNIGMATSLGEDGLIVPVLKNVDNLSLLGVARMVNDLANRARNRKLLPDEVKGGTFTITNHGISGSLFASPIINQPQCGILGVGAIQKRVVVVSDPKMGDVMAIRPMLYVSLTFDHRILDGAIADYFLGKVVEWLQNQ